MRLLDRFISAGRGWSAPEKIGFRDLTEVPRPSLLPWLDRPGLHDRRLTPHQRAWRRDGVVIMPKMLSDEEIDPYVAVRSKLGLQGGWHSPTPYLHVPELRSLALAPKLMRILRDLLGEDMMLHLCLTGWVSTERDWHQDDYLNPGHVNSYYAAVWIALDDIAAESGPFEYIPGSHRWRLMRQARVRRFLTPEEEASRDPRTGAEFWPKLSERFVVPAIAREIARRKIAPVPVSRPPRRCIDLAQPPDAPRVACARSRCGSQIADLSLFRGASPRRHGAAGARRKWHVVRRVRSRAAMTMLGRRIGFAFTEHHPIERNRSVG